MSVSANSKRTILFCMLAALSISASQAGEFALSEQQPCFADAAIDAIEQTASALVQRTDNLVHVQLANGGAPADIYLLTRQTTLAERIQRRVLARGTFECVSSLDSIKRDFSVVQTMSKATLQGNKTLEIDAITTPKAQPLLKEIARLVAVLETELAALKVSEFDND